jgi:hypothetical protein
MKVSLGAVAILAASVAVTWAWPLRAAAAGNSEKTRAAAKLVVETLEREAKEGIEDRADLLKPALDLKPPCEAAYWLSGFIYDGKQKKWLALDEVRQQAAANDSLAEYQKIRGKYAANEADQAVLARWCAKHKLDEQSKAHWSMVLKFSPDHPEARHQLGFQKINGKWLSQREIAENKAQNLRLEAALRRWLPKFQEWFMQAASLNEPAGDAIRQEMKAVKDPEAVPAIAAMLFSQNEAAALFGIELLQGISSPEAASVLAWHAASSPWQPVGQAAANALRSHEKHNYVPLLLEAAELPVGPQNSLAARPNNSNYGNPGQPQVKMVYRLDSGTTTKRWNTVERLNEHPLWWDVQKMKFDPKTPNTVAKNSAATMKKGGNTSTTQQREYFTIRNNRVQERHTENKVTTNWQKLTPVGPVVVQQNPPVMPYPQTGSTSLGNEAAQIPSPLRALAEATGEKRPQNISDWWDWWYDYNEVYQPSANAQSMNARPKVDAEGAEAESQRGDCLTADTLVCTETGLTAIEKIAVGDRVFCCDPETGGLALKSVLQKTIRPEGRTMKIKAGGEEFAANGGHQFWVAGQGWVKTRNLREGMQMHSFRGTMSVEGTELGKLEMTYSLVIADFHTFFVGKGMVLTHDNTIHRPTDRTVPGLPTSKEKNQPAYSAKK